MHMDEMLDIVRRAAVEPEDAWEIRTRRGNTCLRCFKERTKGHADDCLYKNAKSLYDKINKYQEEIRQYL